MPDRSSSGFHALPKRPVPQALPCRPEPATSTPYRPCYPFGEPPATCLAMAGYRAVTACRWKYGSVRQLRSSGQVACHTATTPETRSRSPGRSSRRRRSPRRRGRWCRSSAAASSAPATGGRQPGGSIDCQTGWGTPLSGKASWLTSNDTKRPSVPGRVGGQVLEEFPALFLGSQPLEPLAVGAALAAALGTANGRQVRRPSAPPAGNGPAPQRVGLGGAEALPQFILPALRRPERCRGRPAAPPGRQPPGNQAPAAKQDLFLLLPSLNSLYSLRRKLLSVNKLRLWRFSFGSGPGFARRGALRKRGWLGDIGTRLRRLCAESARSTAGSVRLGGSGRAGRGAGTAAAGLGKLIGSGGFQRDGAPCWLA
jgi:hypothetical protein